MKENLMRTAAVLSLAVAAAVPFASLLAVPGAQARGKYRFCGSTGTTYLTAVEIESDHEIGCKTAHSVIRRYFRQVEATYQVNGGCAQVRSHSFCKVGKYECKTEWRSIDKYLSGQCYGAKYAIFFTEEDQNPGF
jgi:hypothetical protein